MNIPLKLAFALLTLGVSSVAMANNYRLNDVGFGSTYLDARAAVERQIRAECTRLGGRIARLDLGERGKEGNRFFVWMMGYCNGAN